MVQIQPPHTDVSTAIQVHYHILTCQKLHTPQEATNTPYISPLDIYNGIVTLGWGDFTKIHPLHTPVLPCHSSMLSHFDVAKIIYPSRGNKYSIHSTLGYVKRYWYLWLGWFGQNSPSAHWFVWRHSHSSSLFDVVKIIRPSWDNK